MRSVALELSQRILIIEDEERVAGFVKRGLEEEGYEVEVAGDGQVGLEAALAGGYDSILLDVQLPRRDGLSVLKEMRGCGVSCPVMMLTVKGTVEDKVRALNGGADDYLPKPFAFAELLARLRALTRRGALPNASRDEILEAFDVRMDRLQRRVSRKGNPIDLTATEYNLMELFLKHPGEVLTRHRIAEEVWGYDFDVSTNIVDVYVNYLRKKVDQKYPDRLIQTVRGVGYVFRRESES
jgi:DNA-binding response OmpR family regulator